MGAHKNPMLHTSLHKDVVFLLLAGGARTQPSLSKLWQGPGASGPEYRSRITLYHMMEASGGLSTHITPPMLSQEKPGSHNLLQPRTMAQLHPRPWDQALC